MNKYYQKSPIGILELICQNNELISLKLVNNIQKSDIENDFIKNIKLQLEEYFSGKRQKFNIKINPKGTEFQKKIWKELQKIPYGKTKSYSEIAKIINNPNAQRVVGSVCNKNPIIIIIPCHRIISKNGNLGKFKYGNSTKEKLHKIENINNT